MDCLVQPAKLCGFALQVHDASSASRLHNAECRACKFVSTVASRKVCKQHGRQQQHASTACRPCTNEAVSPHQSAWEIERMMRYSGGMARRRSSLCKAGLSPSRLNRQSVERLPLVREEKAKLVALESQCTVLGRDTLTVPSKLMYCNHS